MGLSLNQKVEKVAQIYGVFLTQKAIACGEEGGGVKENWALVWMPDGCQLTKDLRRGCIRSDNEVYSWHVLTFR